MFGEKDGDDLEANKQYKQMIDTRKVGKAIRKEDWDSIAALSHICLWELRDKD